MDNSLEYVPPTQDAATMRQINALTAMLSAECADAWRRDRALRVALSFGSMAFKTREPGE